MDHPEKEKIVQIFQMDWGQCRERWLELRGVGGWHGTLVQQRKLPIIYEGDPNEDS